MGSLPDSVARADGSAGPSTRAEGAAPRAVPPIAVDAEESGRASPPPPTDYEVTVPPGKGPGDSLVVDVSGVTLVVRVPPGHDVGDTFRVPAPDPRDDDAASTPRAMPIVEPTPTVATPIDDLSAAMELQRLELMAYFGGEEPGDRFTELDRAVVAYAASVKCLALFQSFLIMLYSLLLNQLVGFAFVLGSAVGYHGAQTLSAGFTALYLAFCLGLVGYAFWIFVHLRFHFWFFLLFVIGIWIAKIVNGFWRVLYAIGPRRAKEIRRAREAARRPRPAASGLPEAF